MRCSFVKDGLRCKEPHWAGKKNKPYCQKHYMVLYRQGKIGAKQTGVALHVAKLTKAVENVCERLDILEKRKKISV